MLVSPAVVSEGAVCHTFSASHEVLVTGLSHDAVTRYWMLALLNVKDGPFPRPPGHVQRYRPLASGSATGAVTYVRVSAVAYS